MGESEEEAAVVRVLHEMKEKMMDWKSKHSWQGIRDSQCRGLWVLVGNRSVNRISFASPLGKTALDLQCRHISIDCNNGNLWE